MKKVYIGIFFLLLILIAGLNLSPAEDNIISVKNLQEEKPDKINDEIMLEKSTGIKFIDMGIMRASWYGPRFHGRYTANGEIYNQMGLTAAHKSLPFGTLLRITNPKNHKSIIVRINDRGPYIPGRQIDLSKKAALELDTYYKGVVKLQVEKIILSGLELPLIN
ncbi:RlpA-like protein precursor [bacterium BMS3Abin03]|nr:RlpA-like protein precursor [bacterium BMS3Abin03]